VVGLTLSIDQLLDGAWSNEQQAVDTLSELAADGFTSDTVGALVAGLQARMVPVTLADGVTNRESMLLVLAAMVRTRSTFRHLPRSS
jgi:hypothetical protein